LTRRAGWRGYGLDMTVIGPDAFRLLVDVAKAKAGDVVYECIKPDHGAANHDSRRTGVRHLAVTLDPAGGYPFFTVARCDLTPQ